jgi:hypothetical protein
MIIDVAAYMRKHAEEAKSLGQERINFSLPCKSAFVVADCIDRYFSESRPICPVCDRIRESRAFNFEAALGTLQMLLADFGMLLNRLPNNDSTRQFKRDQRARIQVSEDLIRSIRTNRIGVPHDPGQEG